MPVDRGREEQGNLRQGGDPPGAPGRVGGRKSARGHDWTDGFTWEQRRRRQMSQTVHFKRVHLSATLQ